MYLPPCKRLLESLGGLSNPALVKDLLHLLVRAIMEQEGVDEAFYLAEYPDVALAIAGGDTPDAFEHFCRHGYFEERRPCVFRVDEAWYLATYEDVASAIRNGLFLSAQEHYNQAGWQEGRFPSARQADMVHRWNDLIGTYRRS